MRARSLHRPAPVMGSVVGRIAAVAAAAITLTSGCSATPPEPTAPPVPTPPAPPSTTSGPSEHEDSTDVADADDVVEVRLRLERRTDDEATADFAEVATAVLRDPRGWEQAGFRFLFTDDAPYRVVLAEGADVDELCRPYDVGGRFSCQIGPVVALNADRWRYATDSWPGTLDQYRTMLVNHEVGHLLGRHHPEEMCAAPGEPAAVMGQQSGGLRGCAHNPWPLPWEIACAQRHDEPLAPGYEKNPKPTCGPDG